jgi:uncharacterized membrane protein
VTILVAGLIIFLGIHSISIVAPAIRIQPVVKTSSR